MSCLTIDTAMVITLAGQEHCVRLDLVLSPHNPLAMAFTTGSPPHNSAGLSIGAYTIAPESAAQCLRQIANNLQEYLLPQSVPLEIAGYGAQKIPSAIIIGAVHPPVRASELPCGSPLLAVFPHGLLLVRDDARLSKRLRNAAIPLGDNLLGLELVNSHQLHAQLTSDGCLRQPRTRSSPYYYQGRNHI